MQDRIEREVVLKAPTERVYQAIADPTQIVKWFPDGVEGSMEKGSRPVFDFGSYGKVGLYVVAADPHSYFAYRWVPGETETREESLPEDVLETIRVQLARGGWLCGTQFTVADLLLASYLGWCIQSNQLEAEPHYADYVARAEARPAAQRADTLDNALIQ